MEELARAVSMAPEELAMTMEAGAPVESIYKTVYQERERRSLWRTDLRKKKTGRKSF